MNGFNAANQHCLNHEAEVDRTVEFRKLPKGHEEDLVFRKNEITFISDGEIQFFFRDHPQKTLSKGEFIFIPVGGIFRLHVPEDSVVLIMRFNRNVILCDGCRIENLYNHETERQAKNGEIFALKINRPLWHFINGLHETINDGLICRYYFDTKTKELLVLLRTFYTQEELRKFFSLILSPDTEFSEFVRANHHKYKSVKELAEAMCMVPKQFTEKFISVFGESSSDWMNKERALNVYAELHSSNTPIAGIVDKYKFSSQSHLNKFCMREFGKNPGEIRRKRRVQKNPSKV